MRESESSRDNGVSAASGGLEARPRQLCHEWPWMHAAWLESAIVAACFHDLACIRQLAPPALGGWSQAVINWRGCCVGAPSRPANSARTANIGLVIFAWARGVAQKTENARLALDLTSVQHLFRTRRVKRAPQFRSHKYSSQRGYQAPVASALANGLGADMASQLLPLGETSCPS